jgi:hypothetical protein
MDAGASQVVAQSWHVALTVSPPVDLPTVALTVSPPVVLPTLSSVTRALPHAGQVTSEDSPDIVILCFSGWATQ